MKRGCSVQEAVYHKMQELWLRKTFPGVVFSNTNIPEKRFIVCLDESEINNLPKNSTYIFKKKHG